MNTAWIPWAAEQVNNEKISEMKKLHIRMWVFLFVAMLGSELLF